MSETVASVFERIALAMRRLFGTDTEDAPAADAVSQAAALLLAEVARVDQDVKDIDLIAARDGMRELFSLSPEQSADLIEHACRPENRPTSYHAIVRLLNRSLSMQEKINLIEQMWRVAQIDQEIDMYEDHLLRKISDLLYVPHSEFIAAKHRAAKGSA